MSPLFISLALVASACGGSEPSQKLPGATSAQRLGAEGEVLETMTFAYKAEGRLSERVADDARIRFYYDVEDRLALVDVVALEEEKIEEQLVFRYDRFDRVINVDHQLPEDGEVLQETEFQYDAEGGRVSVRSDRFPHAVGASLEQLFQYRYDAAGRLVTEKPMTNEGKEVSYVYVDSGVLRHRDSGDVRRIYEYDDHGNMTREMVVSVLDETKVYEDWTYSYEGWEDASDEEKNARPTETPFMSATVRQ